MLHLKLWLCWRPAQRKGWVVGSGPRAQAVLVLEEQIKWCNLTIYYILKFKDFPRWVWLTIIVAKVLISTAVSGQWPGLSFITLTELHYTVLIQLYPGPLWVDHLIQKWHSLSILTHTEQLSQTHNLSTLIYQTNNHSHFLHQPHYIHVITAQTKPWHQLYYSRSLTCKYSIHLIDTYKIHSSRSHEFDFVYQQTLQDKTDVATVKKQNKQKKKTYSKKGVVYWKVNAWGCFFSIPWNIIICEKQT